MTRAAEADRAPPGCWRQRPGSSTSGGPRTRTPGSADGTPCSPEQPAAACWCAQGALTAAQHELGIHTQRDGCVAADVREPEYSQRLRILNRARSALREAIAEGQHASSLSAVSRHPLHHELERRRGRGRRASEPHDAPRRRAAAGGGMMLTPETIAGLRDSVAKDQAAALLLDSAARFVDRGWTQCYDAVNRHGVSVPPTSRQAECWCMRGALLAACVADRHRGAGRQRAPVPGRARRGPRTHVERAGAGLPSGGRGGPGA